MLHRLASSFSVAIVLLACSSEGGAPFDTTAGSGGGTSAAATGSGGGAPASGCKPSFEGDTVHLAAGAIVSPGDESTMCLRWTTPDDLDISAFVGTIGPAGHHALLLAYPDSKEPDGLAPCSEAEIMDAQGTGTFQMLAGVSYETDGLPYVFPSKPVQVGLHVAAGTQLVFDAHFLNAGGADTEACATLDLSRGKKVIAKLQFHTVLPVEQYTLSIPAQGVVSEVYEQAAPGKYRIAAASSHMHAGGTHFRMSIKETDQTLFETTVWSEPKPALFDKTKVVVEAGQTFRLECSFENTTSKNQYFPTQMCIGGMYLLPCTLPGAC